MRFSIAVGLLLVLGGGALLYQWPRTAAESSGVARARPQSAAAPVATPAAPATSAAKESPPGVLPPDPGRELSYLAIGGGATPASTEVSLEQDLALAEQALPGPHALLFAGGQGSLSVRLLDDEPPVDALLVRLGELFQPHVAHDSRFRASALQASAASLQAVEAQLVAAFSLGTKPLVVYIAAHGQQGQQARDNSVALWGGQSLSVARLAELHDAHPRPLRLVSASCYSGGFAELAFTDADDKRGPSQAPRCGLFAGTWDRETSGCDPDPDRRKQEGYSLHLLQALRGRDRDGAKLPSSDLDFDGDGAISLLEAHTRASIAGRSIDVPTTTAERYLRLVQQKRVAPDLALLPEAAALVRQLGARLELRAERAVRERWEAADKRLRELDARLDQADQAVQDRFGELSARLLARWPVLDDPYHPELAPTLARDRQAITRALDAWPEAQRHAAAERELDALDAQDQQAEVEEAQLLRLLRAYETLDLATALHARGGPQWARFRQLLACERFVPGAGQASPGR